MKKSMFCGLLAAITLAAASSGALAYDRLVVFGDSLSDSGNNAAVIGLNANQPITNSYVPSLPYALGAYTNANVWVNSFAAGLGLPAGAVPSLAGGGNFAFGGARTVVNGANAQNFPPSATTQFGMYLNTLPTVTADSLFVVAVGGNDVRAGLVAVQGGASVGTVAANTAAEFADGVGDIVDALQARGAAHIVVWNAPNVAAAPAVAAAGPLAQGAATFIAESMNGALATRLTGEAGVSIFNLYSAFNTVFVDPTDNIVNVTDACGALGEFCDPSTYLFWDGIHPTSAGHALIANAMLQVVAVPEPGSVLMMAIGLAGLVVVRRRRALTTPGR